jgi:Acetyltransferase (GNAT) family
MLVEFTPLSDACKKNGLGNQSKYYYVFFIGTAREERGQGLCATLIKHYQAVAARDHVPLWLEATTAYSMQLYLKLGFRTVGDMVLGKGKVAPDGTKCGGGEGVKVWGMVWEPQLHGST